MLKLLPLVLFAGIASLLGIGLTLKPHEIPSPLIGKPAPIFEARAIPAEGASFSSTQMLGQVWILNIFASWCVACVTEHPVITQLALEKNISIVGLNYKDNPEAALVWLDRLGNPYTNLLDDRDGSIGLDWGIYGVPETYIIDRNGNVRYKHIGPVDPTALKTVLLPLLDELEQSPS